MNSSQVEYAGAHGPMRQGLLAPRAASLSRYSEELVFAICVCRRRRLSSSVTVRRISAPFTTDIKLIRGLTEVPVSGPELLTLHVRALRAGDSRPGDACGIPSFDALSSATGFWS